MSAQRDDLTFASAGVAGVHYARCWPCMFGQCPGGWHTWADEVDVSYAAKTGQPNPSDKVCGCDCRNREAEVDPGDWLESESTTDAPCAECGERGACGYDAEGRPMIHAHWLDDDEDQSL